jgi:hypothetical protein
VAAPGAARAAPTPGPTVGLPWRAPSVRPAVSVVPSPSPARLASPSPVHTVVPTLTAAPTPQTPSPTEAPAAAIIDESAEELEAPLDWRAFVPTDVGDQLATMDRAARNSGCGVPWHLLAAISRVESDFGRNMATSSAGAIGYGQFLPSSWQAFGNEGNAYDYRDALPAIAAYLCQSGLARDPRAALFAYNHADSYVDLVLELAVRYDRMAPGAPTPGVLDVSPTADASVPIRYAPGRDVRLQTRARALDGDVDWLGVPWRGRAPGTALSGPAMETTTLAMLSAAFGLAGEAPGSSSEGLANRAWDAGLLPLPTHSPSGWSLAEIRQQLGQGRPVVALLDARSLPGHLANEAIGDQPVVVIGVTPEGLVYSDPSYSSSLGYGLEVSDVEFLKAWQEASTPLQALAFSRRPPVREAHGRTADAGSVFARVLATETPGPAATPTAPALVAVVPTETMEIAPAFESISTAPVEEDPDVSWLIILGAGALLSVAIFRRRRFPPV